MLPADSIQRTAYANRIDEILELEAIRALGEENSHDSPFNDGSRDRNAESDPRDKRRSEVGLENWILALLKLPI